jgi:preprotein translocase subunit SecD
LIAPGQLRIRAVLATSDPNAAISTTEPAAGPAAGPTAGPTAGPAAGPTAGPAAGPTTHGPTTNGPTTNGPPQPEPADPTASGQPSGLPGPRAAVAAKLGPAYAAADEVTSFAEGQALAPNVLQAFAALSSREVAVLPEQMQLYVPTISCDVLNDRPANATTQPDIAIVACSGDGQKYLLDEASVTGRDIRAAKVASDQGLWTVTVTLTADGQQRFTALTHDLATGQNGQTDQSGQTSQTGQLAIVVDATIVSAPDRPRRNSR